MSDEAPRPPDGPEKTASGFPWDLALQALGVGASLAAWIAVVGGAKVWARLESAEIPATQTLSTLPRELLIVECLQTLLVPILLGVAAALVVLLLRRVWSPSPARFSSASWRRRPSRTRRGSRAPA